MNPNRLLLIVNPGAGAGLADEMAEHFYSEQVALRDRMRIFRTRQARDVTGIRKAFQECAPDLLVVIGGDGTLNDVLNALHPLKVPVYVLPGGSGNDFYQVLNGQTPYQRPDWKRMKLSPCDLWECNGTVFHNGVGIGFDGTVARSTQYSRFSFLPLRIKYWISIFRNLFTFRSFLCRIESPDFTYEGPAFMISVANGSQYGGGFRVAPDAMPADGLLDVVLLKRVNILRRLLHLSKVSRGKHLHLPYVKHFRCSELRIETGQATHAHLDGEMLSARLYTIQRSGTIQVLNSTPLSEPSA